jgi:hypothetical protein
MAAEIIPFRPPDGLTDAECNEMKAALRTVMPVLCGLEGERAAITTQRNEDGTGYVAAVVETEQGPRAWTLCRERGRYALIGPDGKAVAQANDLDGVLSAIR